MGCSHSDPKCPPSPPGDAEVLRHELSNVLNGFQGMTRLLRDSGLDRLQEQWLEAIEAAAEQMAFLLRKGGVHAFEGGVPGAPVGRFNGQRFLESVVAAHTPAASARGLRLLLCIDPRLPEVWRGAPGPLRQMLDNLLGNALKFSGSGDVMLSAKAGRADMLLLSVSDDGPGVQKSERDRIFGVRERGAGSAAYPGLGIGLAVCRDIANRLGGEIDCAAGDAPGSEFKIQLPGVLGERNPRPKPVTLGGVSCELALDPGLAECVGNMLERLGVGRHEAGAQADSGTDAIQIVIRPAGIADAESCSGLVLEDPGDEKGGRVRLEPPILPSGLERALLTLALRRRWAAVSPGGSRR